MALISEYPADFKFAPGNKTVSGGFRDLRIATVADYSNPNRMLDKLVLELDRDDGGPCSVWLGEAHTSGKLVNEFRRELRLRNAEGRHGFEPGETISITQSDEMRPSRTSGRAMWDWYCEFEFAAARPDAVDVLLADDDADTAQADDAKPAGEPADDDIPF